MVDVEGGATDVECPALINVNWALRDREGLGAMPASAWSVIEQHDLRNRQQQSAHLTLILPSQSSNFRQIFNIARKATLNSNETPPTAYNEGMKV